MASEGGIHTISNGNTLNVYGTLSGGAGAHPGRRLHYVELDENFGQEHSRARREARRRPVGGQNFLSDDEGLKRRSRSATAAGGVGSDYEMEGYLTSVETDANAGALVFGGFEEERLNLKHFKDKYFWQPPGTTSRNATNWTGSAGTSGQKAPRSDTQEHPQQLKSQTMSETATTTSTSGNPKRTQYATLKFNEVNI